MEVSTTFTKADLQAGIRSANCLLGIPVVEHPHAQVEELVEKYNELRCLRDFLASYNQDAFVRLEGDQSKQLRESMMSKIMMQEAEVTPILPADSDEEDSGEEEQQAEDAWVPGPGCQDRHGGICTMASCVEPATRTLSPPALETGGAADAGGSVEIYKDSHFGSRPIDLQWQQKPSHRKQQSAAFAENLVRRAGYSRCRGALRYLLAHLTHGAAL